MREYIALDSYKHYTLAEREDVRTGRVRQERIEHRPGAIREYLRSCPAGTPVAVEALGSWYWIVQEIEQAGMRPRLVHPRKAKLMMGMINKTDKLDVHGLNRLQRNGTLPTVWIAPGPLRDLRELTRTRMVLTQQRARLKNRLGATLDKYALAVQDWSDPCGKGARAELEALLDRLPEQTGFSGLALLEQLDFVQGQIEQHEQRLASLLEETAAMRLQRTLPGFGPILSAVVVLEMGDVGRFPDAEHFASYAGTTPRVHSSGDKTRYGKLRPDVNRYLKWAFMEAANVIVRHHRSWAGPARQPALCQAQAAQGRGQGGRGVGTPSGGGNLLRAERPGTVPGSGLESGSPGRPKRDNAMSRNGLSGECDRPSG